MSKTFRASFATPEDAERASGALLDRGIRPEDLKLDRPDHDGFSAATAPRTLATNVALATGDDMPAMEGSIYGVEVEPSTSGATLSVTVPSGSLDEEEAEAILKKYGSTL